MDWRRWLFSLAFLLAAGGIGGFLIAATGIVPIKASSGHWPVTEWFLNFSMRRSVKTHSAGIRIPTTNFHASPIKSAGYFDLACAPCHGSPDAPAPRLPARMTPHPPSLAVEVPHWAPEELFYIVKHGVKFTGMPGWPSQQRDDEVWSMVEFLRGYPSLTADQYLRLTNPGDPPRESAEFPFGSAANSHRLLATCARCHGWDGHGRGESTIPNLAGQKAAYMENALRAYARGERQSGIMQAVAAELTPESRGVLAEHYSRLPSPPPPEPTASADPAFADSAARGEAIALQGIPSQKTAACSECHGPRAREAREEYPALAGLSADYIALQLDLFADGRRGGSPYARLMQRIAPTLTPEQRRDVGRYYSTLPPAR
jgi:cytochrome c553